MKTNVKLDDQNDWQICKLRTHENRKSPTRTCNIYVNTSILVSCFISWYMLNHVVYILLSGCLSSWQQCKQHCTAIPKNQDRSSYTPIPIFLSAINLNYFPNIYLRWQGKKSFKSKDTHGVWRTIVQPVTYL